MVAYQKWYWYNNTILNKTPKVRDMSVLVLNALRNKEDVMNQMASSGWTRSTRSPNIITRTFNLKDGTTKTYRYNFKKIVVNLEALYETEFKNTFSDETKIEKNWCKVRSYKSKNFGIFQDDNGDKFFPFLKFKYKI